MVGVGGFEPPTSRSRTVRSSLTELHPEADRRRMLSNARRKCRGEDPFAGAWAPGGAVGFVPKNLVARRLSWREPTRRMVCCIVLHCVGSWCNQRPSSR